MDGAALGSDVERDDLRRAPQALAFDLGPGESFARGTGQIAQEEGQGPRRHGQ